MMLTIILPILCIPGFVLVHVKGQMENDYPYHALVSVEFTKNGFDFVSEEIQSQVEKRVNNLTIPDIRLYENTSSINANVTNIRIQHFLPPNVTVQLAPPSTLKLILSGGQFKVCAHLSARKFLSVNDEVCASLEESRPLSAKVFVNTIIDENGERKLTSSHCHVDVPLDTKLPFPYLIQKMLSPLRMLFENIIQNTLSSFVCKIVKEKVEWIFQQTMINITQEYGLQYKLHEFIVSNHSSLTVQLATNFTYVE